MENGIDRLLSTPEAAKMLGYSTNYLSKLATKGYIKAIKPHARANYRFRLSDIKKLMEGQQ